MNNSSTSSGWLTLRFWLISFGFWAALLALQMGVVYSSNPAMMHEPWGDFLANGWTTLVYPVVTPILFECAYRLGRRQLSIASYLARLMAAAMVASMFMIVVVNIDFYRLDYDAPDLAMNLVFMGVTYLFQFCAILGVGVAVNQFRFAQQRRQELLASQLRMLRSQLQPHFLFNTLQAISVTIKQDPDAAASMLALLGDLLRQTLRERDGDLVTLGEEQELLRPYVELQERRFGDRLTVDLDMPSEVLAAAVPDMILQPLVENALQHGIESMPGVGSVRIRARRRGEDLELEVADDGVGPSETDIVEGIGLGTTRARLQALFGDRAELSIVAGGKSGTVVVVRMPWQEIADAA